MSQWQQRFAEKVEMVRMASRERFDSLSEKTIGPVFEQLRMFTGKLGVQSSCPVSKEGLRTFKFSMSENAYALMCFRLCDLEHGEATCEFFVPGKNRPAPTKRTVCLAEMDADWVRSFFEASLDCFVESFIETLAAKGQIKAELVGA